MSFSSFGSVPSYLQNPVFNPHCYGVVSVYGSIEENWGGGTPQTFKREPSKIYNVGVQYPTFDMVTLFNLIDDVIESNSIDVNDFTFGDREEYFRWFDIASEFARGVKPQTVEYTQGFKNIVEKIQPILGLSKDGKVGKNTWIALGVNPSYFNSTQSSSSNTEISNVGTSTIDWKTYGLYGLAIAMPFVALYIKRNLK